MANNKKITRSDLATARRATFDLRKILTDMGLSRAEINKQTITLDFIEQLFVTTIDPALPTGPLTEREVREVRSLFLTGMYSNVDLAAFYGVSTDEIEQAL